MSECNNYVWELLFLWTFYISIGHWLEFLIILVPLTMNLQVRLFLHGNVTAICGTFTVLANYIF